MRICGGEAEGLVNLGVYLKKIDLLYDQLLNTTFNLYLKVLFLIFTANILRFESCMINFNKNKNMPGDVTSEKKA